MHPSTLGASHTPVRCPALGCAPDLEGPPCSALPLTRKIHVLWAAGDPWNSCPSCHTPSCFVFKDGTHGLGDFGSTMGHWVSAFYSVAFRGAQSLSHSSMSHASPLPPPWLLHCATSCVALTEPHPGGRGDGGGSRQTRLHPPRGHKLQAYTYLFFVPNVIK